MNLQNIRDYIANVTDYDALVNEEYTKQVDDVVNEVYRNLFAEKPFTFAQKETKVKVYKDVTLSASGSYSSSLNLTTITATTDIPYWVEGNIVEIDSVEYEVLFNNRTTDTVCYIRGNVPFTTQDIRFKQRFIRLPHDCITVLQVARRSYEISPTDVGRFIPLTRYEDEYYNLPLDETNIPNYWLPQDAVTSPAPRSAPSVSIAVASAGQGERSVQVAYTYVRYDKNGVADEVESGLSPFSDPITLGDAEELEVTFPGLTSSGLSRRFYIADAAEVRNFDGFYQVGDTIAPTTFGTQTFTFTQTQFEDGTFVLDNPKFPASAGYKQTIRLYPRQNEDFELTVRYIFRPAPLVEPTDTVELPSSHANTIAYGALFDILNKHDNAALAAVYKQKYDRELIKLEQRFLTQQPRRFVKGFMQNSGVDTVPMFTPLKRLP